MTTSAIIISAIYVIFAVATAPQIRIEGHTGNALLSAGRARISLADIRSARELTFEEQRGVARGTRNDTAFQLTQGKLPMVELEISDPMDPHKNWCLSTRTPERLIQAILSAHGPEIS